MRDGPTCVQPFAAHHIMLYHLIVGFGPDERRPWHLPTDRVIREYSDDAIRSQYKPNGRVSLEVTHVPALAFEEIDWSNPQEARVGFLHSIDDDGANVAFSFSPEPKIPPISSKLIFDHKDALEIDDWQFTRTHWSMKRGDLFRFLYTHALEHPSAPNVVDIRQLEPIQQDHVSVMMRFRPDFDQVYDAIEQAATANNLKCFRADRIDENSAVITDIAKLIMRSKVVIVDLTDLNPNVLYEYGLACGIGREFVSITQDGSAPFDIAHNRFIRYQNTPEGRAALTNKLTDRLARYSTGASQ